MSNFNERLAIGLPHERRVIAELEARGWRVAPYGQGQLPPHIRDLLRHHPTPVRFTSDIIAVKVRVVFIDAKGGERYRDTGRHAIEVSALEAAGRFESFAECEQYFVFDDLGVFTPADVHELAGPGTYRGQGSGTPFVLIPAADARKFDVIFGQRIKGANP